MSNNQKYIFILLISLKCTLMFPQSVLISTTPIPKHLNKIDSISLIPESFGYSKSGSISSISFVVKLINPTKDTLKYIGYGFSLPWWRLQILDSLGGEFKEYDQGWFCWTGIKICVIPPKMCADINIGTFKRRSRIGINYWLNSNKTEKTVWTRLIDKIKIE